MIDNISIIILTKNSSKYIKRCLEALKDFSEIIIVDNGSTDDTIQISKSFDNVKLYEHQFIGFGPLKNFAISLTSNSWVLCMDSDEVLSYDLINEIKSLKLDKKEVYAILRHNHYNGKLIKRCGWNNDFVKRLFYKKYVKFNDNLVHEDLLINSRIKTVKLKNSMKHYTYDNASQLLQKADKYSTLFAKQNRGLKKSSPLKAFLNAIYSFIKTYLFKRGFLDGYEGLLVAFSHMCTNFFKYIKLYEINKKDKNET